MANYKKIPSNENQITEMTNLTSSRMGDSSLDYDLPIEKDIPITNDTMSNDYYKSKKRLASMKATRKGNMIMMCYNSSGEPLIAIGPHWPFTICMMLFMNMFIFFYFHFLKNYLNDTVRKVGLGISFIQILSYILIFLLNPGIPQKDLWIENYFKNRNASSSEDIDSYRICNICKIVRRNSDNTVHCEKCNICIKGLDHHCSWIGTCIGIRNYSLFFFFILTLNLSQILFIVVSIIHICLEVKSM